MPSVLDPGTSCRLFADDCLIYRSIRTVADQVILQKDLEALYSWGLQWGLKFNVSKCNMLHLSRSQEKPCRFYTLGGQVIVGKQEAQYLGVTLSTNYGTRSSPWKAHIHSIAGKAQKKLGFLRRSLRGCPYQLRELAYISLVRSSLEYAGVIWDTTVKDEADRLEMVQRRAARWASGVGSREVISVTALLNTLHWRALDDRRRISRLSLFYKILNGDIVIPPEDVDLVIHRPSTLAYRKHRQNLRLIKGKDTCSPLWQGTIARTIVQWNALDDTPFEASESAAEPALYFKAQLMRAP